MHVFTRLALGDQAVVCSDACVHKTDIEMTVVCSDGCLHSEMRQLTVEMDRLAPLVIEAARFVAAGDTAQTGSLRLLADDWVNAVCSHLSLFSMYVCLWVGRWGRWVHEPVGGEMGVGWFSFYVYLWVRRWGIWVLVGSVCMCTCGWEGGGDGC